MHFRQGDLTRYPMRPTRSPPAGVPEVDELGAIEPLDVESMSAVDGAIAVRPMEISSSKRPLRTSLKGRERVSALEVDATCARTSRSSHG
jgi:hypothetical protein